MSLTKSSSAANAAQDSNSPTTSAKENAAPLRQSTLLTALDKGKGKKKRTLALANGDELDLMSSLPVTPEVLEAMRTRIVELEDELTQQPPAKRARTSNVASAPDASTSAAAGPSAASVKADEKKRKMQVKKVFDRLKKECKSDAVKFQGSPKSIKIDEVYSEAEFNLLFSGKGQLIQPTANNKPKSVVTIIQFNSQAHFDSFFGDELKPLKGNVWSRGGMPQRTFGAGFGGFGSSFSKSQKLGAVDVSIRSFEVNYSKNNMKCSLKFEVVQQGGGGGCGGYSDYESDY
ncbi:hypothetical protein GALMADRAFT_223970 [Galerina marginata CBS 339.88]|uniref:Uncharacterized protein n=1 Tax=Galerina marginata (strain CBS 339.88) TaxID=685588 RepID=A0A067T6F2_GALM3|nr:hypothetical protein GALMADRAFT_223970 [Galerina marginata CBS 339.88]